MMRFVYTMTLLFLVVSPLCGADENKPNVILIMCDDLGWGDVGFNGNTIINTPHLDEMATHSLKFNRFYAQAPVCSPTRGSCITGRHPYRYGITSANTGHMKDAEFTLAEALKQHNYATGHFGKWHMGTLTTSVKDANRGGPRGKDHFAPPWQHGFDVCFSTESKVPTFDPMRMPTVFEKGESKRIGWDALSPDEVSKPLGTRYWDQQGKPVTENLRGPNPKVITDRVIPFLESCVTDNKPFLAVVWFHTPHLPVVASDEYRKPYAAFDSHRQNYYGCITAMDEQVGRIREKLKQLGVNENTIVCFASDNGPEGKDSSPGSAGPFRGRKRSLYEGGIRVPGLIEWPAKVKPGQTDFPATTSDYMPTILAAVGHKPTDARPVDGISLLPVLGGEATTRPQPICFQSRGVAALSDDRFKLLMPNGENKTKAKRLAAPELYDLLADPAEQNNIASEHPQRVKEMQATLSAWIASCKASADGGDYPNRADK